MYKPNNKKMLTVLITVAMVFSALAILSFAAEPAYAASGTFTVNPTTYVETSSTTAQTTTAYVSGGTFGSGSTVYFYLSKSNLASDILNTTSGSGGGTTTANAIGHAVIAGTTLANVVTFTFSSFTIPAGHYYTLAEDYISNAPSGTYAVGPEVTFVKVTNTPTIAATEGSSAATSGLSLKVTGSNFDPGASVTVYYTYPGNSSILTTTTTSSVDGSISTTLTGISLAKGSYSVVAEETNTLSTSFPLGGATADGSFTISPEVATSVSSISGSTSSSFTLYGFGFPAKDTFAASTSTNPVDTITLWYSASVSVDAINPGFSSSAQGYFTVQVTGLAKTLTTYGVYYIGLNDSSTAYKSVGTITVSTYTPSALGFDFSVVATTGTTYNVNDSVTATVWNFPASATVMITLGQAVVGNITTDSNGAGSLSTVVPAVPAGSYHALAVDSAINMAAVNKTATKISPDFLVTDPSGASLAGQSEYVPNTGVLTVMAFGLTPTTAYDVLDSAITGAPNGIYANNSSFVTIMVGTGSTSGIYPAANGTLILTYMSQYPGTSGSSTITLTNSVPAYNGKTYGYQLVGAVTFSTPSSSYSILKAGATGQSVGVSGIIPTGSTLYPGLSDQYSLYFGNTLLTVEVDNSGTYSYSTVFNSTYALTAFNVSSTMGIFDLNVTYKGQSASSAIASIPVVVSSSGPSLSSGSLVLIQVSSTDYTVVGYGLNTSLSTVTLYYYTSSGISTGASESSFSTHYGAFADKTTMGSLSPEPAGTYAVFLELTTSSGTNYYIYSSYTVTANLTLLTTSGGSTQIYSGTSGTTVYVEVSGLVPTTYYNVYFGTGKYITDTGANLALGTDHFNVPPLADGIYTVEVVALSSSPSANNTAPASGTVVASAGFEIVAPTSIVLSTDAPVAFPGQLVTYSWTPASQPKAVGSSSGAYGPVEVSVLFNGTVISTVPAAVTVTAKPVAYLNGSFLMPNDAVGSYWTVTLSWTQVHYGATPTVSTYTAPSGAYIQLVSGNGALLTGVTSSQIATLEADVNSSIKTSMKVPLSELNASIVSLNNLTATIKTAFGTMTTTLSTINATVASIESGQVLVQTDLGSIKTSLSSLNASIAAFNGNVATISTTLGNVQASLSSIGTQVTTNGNGIATIKTDVGTIQGQILSTNGNISTIKTSLGTLQTNVTKITPGLSTLEIFLIVAIVLILITLVIAFLAVNNTNKLARKLEEQKKP